MRRREVIAIIGALPAGLLARAAFAQARARRIAFLGNSRKEAEPFLLGMRELGYIEGKDYLLRWQIVEGEYDRLAKAVARVLEDQPDVIVAAGSAPIRALQRATQTVPVVMAISADPVGAGFVKSLSRPGGNITGLTRSTSEASLKYVQLLKTMVPNLARLAVLTNPGNPSHAVVAGHIREAAERFQMSTIVLQAADREAVHRSFGALAKDRAQALIITADGFFIVNRVLLVDLTLKDRLPTLFPDSEDVAAGGLMNYGQPRAEFYRGAASYVDRIFKGEKPGDLPVDTPTKFELTINRKTAKLLGLTIPNDLLFRADRIFD